MMQRVVAGLLGVCAMVMPPAAGAQVPRPDTLGQQWEYDGLTGRYRVQVVATGVRVPFALEFLPDGRLLVSDRPDGLFVVDVATGVRERLSGTPAVFDSLDAGWLDAIVHPDHLRNGLIYYAFTEGTDSGRTTVVERARLRGTSLTDRQRLFAAYPAMGGANHFGARLLLDGGYLFITLGERDVRELAQEMWTDHGKIIRLHDDGRIPVDNPFVGRAGARAGIWSLGHRNPHGLARHPATGALWSSDHGPLGGDEVNVVRRGANYGWPLVTFGREYQGHGIEGSVQAAPGFEAPLHHYASSAAPSGLLFYTGDAFPAWQGNLFMGVMTPRYLSRLIVDPGRPPREEKLLLEQRWRVRDVAQGPDGLLYLGVERSSRTARDGMIVRLSPAP